MFFFYKKSDYICHGSKTHVFIRKQRRLIEMSPCYRFRRNDAKSRIFSRKEDNEAEEDA
jgi:hypothetical protein